MIFRVEPEQDARQAAVGSRQQKMPPGARLEAGRIREGAPRRVEAGADIRPGRRG